MMSDKQLMRSEDRMVAGVAGGLAEYFDIDPTIIRILFVLLAIFGGGFLGILIYIVLWIIMPDPLDAT
ncbi:MAG: PspC domain-containing protein [Chloroflexota bacterium]